MIYKETPALLWRNLVVDFIGVYQSLLTIATIVRGLKNLQKNKMT
jgi:hypothetical protein